MDMDTGGGSGNGVGYLDGIRYEKHTTLNPGDVGNRCSWLFSWTLTTASWAGKRMDEAQLLTLTIYECPSTTRSLQLQLAYGDVLDLYYLLFNQRSILSLADQMNLQLQPAYADVPSHCYLLFGLALYCHWIATARCSYYPRLAGVAVPGYSRGSAWIRSQTWACGGSARYLLGG
ncbi:hypothetical protein BDQ17DRAFT_540631 [Cyathus striatus]|nr:hypothetical protein BDQ17DRAFT_540631 [Cyathus striatus]